MSRIAVRLLADEAIVALCLFVPAGTVAWPRAWVLLVVLLSVRTIGAYAAYRVNPALLEERAKFPVRADQPPTDRVLLLAVLATGFLGVPIMAALDVFHWHLLAAPSDLVSSTGLLLFALGWSLKAVALRANAFATSVVRLQSDRGHAVADSGVYAAVRHPFYAADPLVLVGLALWLGSFGAAVFSIIPVALVVVRLLLEERFLLGALPGYGKYMARVRYRLIPGVW